MLGIVWRAAVLLGVGAGLGLGVNALRPDGVALSAFRAPVTCSIEPTGARAAPTVQILSQAEAASMCTDPSAQIADVRSASAYAEGHVAGAVHLPCSASARAAASAVSGFSATKLLVYGERTEDAVAVAEELQRRLGATGPRVAVLEGGFSAWRAAGLACASGACGECEALDHRDHAGSAP